MITYIYIYAYIHIYIYVYILIYIYAYTYIHTCIYICISSTHPSNVLESDTPVCVYVYVCACVCVYVHTRILLKPKRLIHMHVSMYMCVCVRVCAYVFPKKPAQNICHHFPLYSHLAYPPPPLDRRWPPLLLHVFLCACVRGEKLLQKERAETESEEGRGEGDHTQNFATHPNMILWLLVVDSSGQGVCYIHILVCTYVYMCTYTRKYGCIYVYVRTYMYVYMCICIYLCI